MGKYDARCKYNCADIAMDEIASAHLCCMQCAIKWKICEDVRLKHEIEKECKKREEENRQLRLIEAAHRELKELILRNSDPLPGEIR